MSIRARTFVRLSALIWVLAPVLAYCAIDGSPGGTSADKPATNAAATRPTSAPATQAAPLVPPDASTFRVFDRPSDDGSVIGVEWGRSPSERKGVYYIVEVASKEDCQAGKFKEVRVPSLAGLKADHPEYFGFSESLRELHYAAVRPAQLYDPKPKPEKPPKSKPTTAASRPGPTTAASRPGATTASSRPGPTTAASKPAPAPAAKKPQKKAPSKDVDPWEQGRRKYKKKREKYRLRAKKREIESREYYVRLAISDGQQKVYVEADGRPKLLTGRARANYFKFFKLNNLIFSVVFGCIVLSFIRLARRNPNLFIRKIAGLDAVEEAIGRATEMGRPAFFVHGLAGMQSLPTIAAVSILGRICRRAAEYDTRVRVMNNNPIVLAVSQEVVKQAYTEAGRPDAYDPDDVSLVAYDQFSYVAAVGGRMARERPAAIFLMGYFFAESLLLAETGAATGAIQIAGTDAYTQLPFFVTTCDYTLIGEELYAASAYLSREPRLLGSLRGQDIGKAFLMLIFIVGTVLASFGLSWITELFRGFS